MLFSIIIPVFNTEKYLRKCLNSILLQTYRNFEVIVINDGSTDSSSSILDEYASKDSRVKVLHLKNKGVTMARQIGLAIAKGEFIFFVDSDDTINPELLSNIKNTIEEYPDVDIIRFKCNMINDRPGFSSELYNDYNSEYEVIYSGIEAIKKWTKPEKRYEVFWLYAIKKDKLLKLYDCPNFKTSGDYAFVPFLIATCERVFKIDYVGYNYTCDNQDSLTHIPGYEQVKSRTVNFIKAYNYLISNMHLIEEKSGVDLQFFYNEWKQRLLKRYNIIDESLRAELKQLFEDAFNQ